MFDILDFDQAHELSPKAARERGGLCRVRDVLPAVLACHGVQPQDAGAAVVAYAADSSALLATSAAC